MYTRGVEGAVIGEHKVSISTYVEGDPDSDVAAAPERVPAKYNAQTELTREVEDGSNSIDFELDSKSPILSPQETVEQDLNTC
jgi:hypothetical protein